MQFCSNIARQRDTAQYNVIHSYLLDDVVVGKQEIPVFIEVFRNSRRRMFGEMQLAEGLEPGSNILHCRPGPLPADHSVPAPVSLTWLNSIAERPARYSGARCRSRQIHAR